MCTTNTCMQLLLPPLVVTLPQAAARLWWTCVPTIKACFTDSGVMELFWEPPSVQARPIIRGYQVGFIIIVANIVEVVVCYFNCTTTSHRQYSNICICSIA